MGKSGMDRINLCSGVKAIIKGALRPNFDAVIERKRRKWETKWDLLAACMTMSVGLSNFWRFPYVAYLHGGGSFLLPYLIVLFGIGRPLFYLELCMGQFSGHASIRMYRKLGLIWTGLGITQTFAALIIAAQYAYVLAIALYYLGQSFDMPLPWQTNIVNMTGYRMNKSMDFFKNSTLHGHGFDGSLGMPNFKLCILLAITWLASFGMQFFGVRSSVKAAYVACIFPQMLVFSFLVKACSLDGAIDGIMYFIRPRWKAMMRIHIWAAAVLQCFMSLGIGYGVVTVFATHYELNPNVNLIVLLTTLGDLSISMLSGLTLFATLGNSAARHKFALDSILDKHLLTVAFVFYPEAVLHFERNAYIFAIMFFMMLILLGIGTITTYIHILTTNLAELYTQLHEWRAAIIACTCGFLVSIIFTTHGGLAIFSLMDIYGGLLPLIFVIVAQLVAICYVLDFQTWCWDIEFAMETYLSTHTRWQWCVIIPVFMLVITYNLQIDGYLEHQKMYTSLIVLASLVCIGCVGWPIGIAIFYAIKYGRKKNLGKIFSTYKWRPDDLMEQNRYDQFIDKKLDEYPYEYRSRFFRFWMALFKVHL